MSEPKILRVGVLNAIHNAVPHSANDAESMFVVKQIYGAPFRSPLGSTEVEPHLFEGPLEQVDALHYRAKVRNDLKFSDGTPLDARTVAECLNSANTVHEQAEVRADGDHVELTLKRPNARFDLILGHGQCSVYRKVGERYLGTGPYALHDDSTPTHMRLVRNPHYPDSPAIDEIHFQTYDLDAAGKPTALLEAVEAGEIDLTNALGRDDVTHLGGVRKYFQRGTSIGFLYLNTESPRLGDARLRRAIAHSIDRFEVAKGCYQNALAFAADGYLPRQLGAAEDDLGHDPDRARQLLAEPGLEVPDELELLVVWGPRPYMPEPRTVSRILSEQLTELGIGVRAHFAESSRDYFDRVIAGKADMVLAGWVADTMDPTDFLESNLASSRVPTTENITVSTNSGRLRNGRVDEFIEQYRSERTEELLTTLARLVDDEAPLVPLIYGASSTTVSFRVQGFSNSPLAHYPLDELDLT